MIYFCIIVIVFCIRLHFIATNKIRNCERLQQKTNDRFLPLGAIREIHNFIVKEHGLRYSHIKACFRIWDWSSLCSIEPDKREKFISFFPGE